MSFLDKWNKSKFNVYESEEKTVLKLLTRLGNFIGELSLGVDNKTDLTGDHKGSWQGINKPTLSEEGMRGTVEKHITDIENLVLKDNEVIETINDLDIKIANDLVALNSNIDGKLLTTNNNLAAIKNRYDKFIGKALYLSDYPDNSDYSTIINNFCNTNEDRIIVCEPNKEYRFNNPLNFKGQVKIIGNDSLWRYMGTGSNFITFVESPWQCEGSVIEDLKIWCNEKSVGAYQNKYCFTIQGYHICLKFNNLKIYNFGYVWFIKDTDINNTGVPHHTFGHTISNCNVWGFITAINCRGNAEQILVEHCWFDDGLRIENSQNAVIRIEDATSFWVRNCTIQNADIGIAFKGVRNGEIFGCHFENMIHSSIWFYPSSAYDNRNNLVMNNYLVGHKYCIYFYTASAQDLKNIHTHIIGNYFAFLGETSNYLIGKVSDKSESNTLMMNNSKLNATWGWYPSNLVTMKEFQ